MKEEDKKIIFDYMGWCWHEWLLESEIKTITDGCCIKCGKSPVVANEQLHPLDSNAMLALMNKIAKKGDWEKFEIFSRGVFVRNLDENVSRYIAWLFTLERFFNLFIESEIWKP